MCQVSSGELDLVDPLADPSVDLIEGALERSVDGAEIGKCGGQARAQDAVIDAGEEQRCPESELGDAIAEAFGQAFDPALGGEDLRDAFKMVHAKAPRDDRDQQPFREHCWEIWSETLYDNLEPDTASADGAFVFDLGDDDAPHYPLEIIGDESYARFNPRSQDYPLSTVAYEPVFGRFLAGVRAMLGLP